MRERSSRGLGVAVLLGAALVAPFAQAATPQETAAARSAAQAGLAAYNQGDYAKAADLFERAESLRHAPSHLLYQAQCQEKLGNLVGAREFYIKLTREQLPADAPQAFRDAQRSAEEKLGAVDARIPYVTIVVKGDGARDAEVTIDDAAVPKAALGIPYPVNPGKHRFAATTARSASRPTEASVTEGKNEQVELTLVANAGTAPSTTPTLAVTSASAKTNPVQDSQPASGSWMKPAGWMSIGVGAVGVGFGTFMYLRGASKRSDADAKYEEICASSCTDTDLGPVNTLDASAEKAGTLSTLGFIAGGVGLASGITLLVLAPDGTKKAALVPWLSPTSVGVSGRF